MLVLIAAMLPLVLQAPSGVVTGRVVDAKSGAALAGVRVKIQATNQETYASMSNARRGSGIVRAVGAVDALDPSEFRSSAASDARRHSATAVGRSTPPARPAQSHRPAR